MPTDPKDLICPGCGGRKSRQAKRCAACSGSGHTSEQRDHLSTPLCGAMTKRGVRCRAFAGQGTPTPGVGVCKYHGGSTGAHRSHAVALDLKRRMVTYGQPIEDVTAPGALMGLLRASAGAVAWLQQEVAGLDSLGSHEAQVLVNLYDQERSMLVRVSEACVRAGIAEHLIRMETAQAEMTLRAIRDAAQDAGLNQTQVQTLGVALRKRLADAVDDPDAARIADQADARLAELRDRSEADDERRINREADRRARELSGLTFPPDELVPEDSDTPSEPPAAA